MEALVIIDVQNDYFPSGACELYCANEALEQVIRLETYFRGNQLPVFYVQHIADENAGRSDRVYGCADFVCRRGNL